FEDIPIEKLSKAIGDIDGLLKKYDEQREARGATKKRLLHRKDKEEHTSEEKE
ncbi:unnamed protein product, partial [marine sediment metagenome]